MHVNCTYRIEVRGQVEENRFNRASPLQVTVVQVNPATTRFTVCADQSGLVGLIRHLPRQGFVLLSVTREE